MLVADLGHDVDALANAAHTEARIISAGYPQTPDFERIAGIEATVRVRISLDAAGRLTRSQIMGAGARPRLDTSALRVVREATYAPAIRDGHPVGGDYEVDVSFAGE